MSQLNDISLVAQVVVFRNTRAFDQLVQKYQSPVRRFFLNLTCGDSELSDDLAQDTFIKAYTNIANFKTFQVSQHGFTELLITYFMIIFAAERKQRIWMPVKWMLSTAPNK